ncbi:MAG: hypothetical protein AB1610_04915 [Nitrospirota bacterium]
MAKLSDANKNILPEFQKFLIERKLAPEKKLRHFMIKTLRPDMERFFCRMHSGGNI